MAKHTILISFLLIVVGLGGFFLGHPDAATGHVSYTALIPTWIGLLLGILGGLSLNDKLRKHVMHAAAMIGLLSIIAVATRLPGAFSDFQQNKDTAPLKLGSMLATLILCVVFVILCIRSFIAARRNRPADYKG